MGALGTIFALGIVALKMLTQISPIVVEGLLSLLLAVMNGCGVGYLTSPSGPGSAIGNLYYFSWLSFLSSFMLIADIWQDHQNGGASATEEEGNKIDGDIPIETIETIQPIENV